jgi:hypothetical protein
VGLAVSALVDRAIESAGLGDVLAARRRGGLSDAVVVRLRDADLLVLGALADRVRADEVGPEVRIWLGESVEDPSSVTFPGDDRDRTGLELLREIAIARVTGPGGVRLRVDWMRCGLELAQVALGFGADELVGRIATKRGLPIAEGELSGVGKKSRRELAQSVKLRELAGYVRRAGRQPVIIGHDGAPQAFDEGPAVQEANP